MYQITKENYEAILDRIQELEYLLNQSNTESREWKSMYTAVRGLVDKMLDVMLANGGALEKVGVSRKVDGLVDNRGENHD